MTQDRIIDVSHLPEVDGLKPLRIELSMESASCRFHYAVDGKEEQNGIRFDMEKKGRQWLHVAARSL